MSVQANPMHLQYTPLVANNAEQSDALIKASKAGDAFLVRILAKLATPGRGRRGWLGAVTQGK